MAEKSSKTPDTAGGGNHEGLRQRTQKASPETLAKQKLKTGGGDGGKWREKEGMGNWKKWVGMGKSSPVESRCLIDDKAHCSNPKESKDGHPVVLCGL